MAAAVLNETIEQGASFTRTLTFKDQDDVAIDLTGYIFSGQIRLTPTETTSVATFSFSLLNQVSNTGQVICRLTHTQTSAIPVDTQKSYDRKSKKYSYDIEMELPDGTKLRVLEGVMTVSPEVTR